MGPGWDALLSPGFHSVRSNAPPAPPAPPNHAAHVGLEWRTPRRERRRRQQRRELICREHRRHGVAAQLEQHFQWQNYRPPIWAGNLE